jgi:hypothetical protein
MFYHVSDISSFKFKAHNSYHKNKNLKSSSYQSLNFDKDELSIV